MTHPRATVLGLPALLRVALAAIPLALLWLAVWWAL